MFDKDCTNVLFIAQGKSLGIFGSGDFERTFFKFTLVLYNFVDSDKCDYRFWSECNCGDSVPVPVNVEKNAVLANCIKACEECVCKERLSHELSFFFGSFACSTVNYLVVPAFDFVEQARLLD